MKIDKRTKKGRLFKTLVSKEMLCTFILGLFAGFILGKSIFDAQQVSKKLLDPRGTPIDVGTNKPQVKKLIKEVEAKERFCADVIKCIRDVGEEMGESNQHIMQMIRIAKSESGMRADAIGKNKNGTFDIGVFQINDVHNKRISRADRLDFQKNIRFAYKLHQEQGHSFRAWVAYNKGLAK